MDTAEFSLDLFSLAGRNALVTGGNTGLGRAFSVALAKAGADVFAVGLAEADVEAFGRDQWDPMVSVNLTASFELAHEASTFMIKQRSGKIINIASLFS